MPPTPVLIDRFSDEDPSTKFVKKIPTLICFVYTAAFFAAFSGIAYELLLASYATFLLGATIFQYSLVLSVMMASMGCGALLVQRVNSSPIFTFLILEILLAWIALLALPTMYSAFALDRAPRVTLLFFVISIGITVGMEIPLLNEIPKKPDLLPYLLAFDYMGGFIGGLVFPLWFFPKLGFFQMAGVLALVNTLLGLTAIFLLKKDSKKVFYFSIIGSLLTLALSIGFIISSEKIRHFLEFRYFGITVY